VLFGVPAGGTQDVLTRAIAQEVRDSLGPLVVDNRSGAAGRIAVEAVKTAAPNGRTVLLGTAGMMTMFPSAYKNLSYDPIKDFQPIVNAARFELALVVHKDVPANTLGRVHRLGQEAARRRELCVLWRGHAVAPSGRDASKCLLDSESPLPLQHECRQSTASHRQWQERMTNLPRLAQISPGVLKLS
jgi:hypothetical protein